VLLVYIRDNASGQVCNSSLLVTFLLVLFISQSPKLIILLRNGVT